jgi:hypothetical protein
VVLLGVLGAMAVIGVRAALAPLPGGSSSTTKCSGTEKQVKEFLKRSEVQVSVFNAGTRLGLANRTMDLFTGQGFGAGDLSNAPDGAGVNFAQIWTEDPTSPAVKLVKTRLGRFARIVKRTPPGPGVAVIVGNDFNDLKKGKKHVTSDGTYEICMPSSS